VAVWRAGWFAAYPGIIAADINQRSPSDADLENADPGDFGGPDASDAGLQTALTVLAVLAGDPDGLEVPAAPGGPRGS